MSFNVNLLVTVGSGARMPAAGPLNVHAHVGLLYVVMPPALAPRRMPIRLARIKNSWRFLMAVRMDLAGSCVH
jgi:hypothetical protein